MSLRLRSRLQSLERGVVSVHGCPGCRHRQDRIALVDIVENTDGSVLLSQYPLPVCAACGQVPELVVEVVAAAVDSPAAVSDSVP